MHRLLTILTILLVLPLPCAWGQNGEPPSPEEKGTFLGVLISRVPEALYDQVAELPSGQGVLVTHVLPGSPAAQGGLKRHDILLRYNDDTIRDCEHFARLIRADRADSKIKLELLRGGRKQKVEVTLALGPVLKIAQANRAITRDTAEVTRGIAKQGGPPSVSVAATPLDSGRMKVNIEYYQEATGRLRTVTAEGLPEEIDREVEKLPAKVQHYTHLALQRMRRLELQSAEAKTVAPKSAAEPTRKPR